MNKIRVAQPLVEIDGDEMAHVIWQWIKDRLILPHLDVELEYFDLSLPNRDRTQDRITLEAAHATRRYGVAVKCATITHDPGRMAEFGSPRMFPSPNGTIRTILNGTLFREPVLFRNIPRLVPHWDRPIVVARHAFGDQQSAAEFAFRGKGRLRLIFTPDDGGESVERVVCQSSGDGIALAMYNIDESIIGFARACLNYGLLRRYPVYLSTKNTILKVYDGRFKDLFEQVFQAEFAGRFAAAGIGYEHKLIDDMVACNLKWRGGYLWACKNYDGDVQSDTVAQGFGSLGLMTSVLMSPDGRAFESEAAHGTVRRHYQDHLAGKPTSTNPVASIFAWTRALARRGELDGTPEVTRFAQILEQVCIEHVEGGNMTRDLAYLIGPEQPWQTTERYLDGVAAELERRL